MFLIGLNISEIQLNSLVFECWRTTRDHENKLNEFYLSLVLQTKTTKTSN